MFLELIQNAYCGGSLIARDSPFPEKLMARQYLVSPIGRNSGVLIGGEHHQNSVSRFSSNSGGFCAAKTGFDGLSSVVLVRFCSNFLKAPGISSYRRNRTFGRAM
jgi:hypothetical protein